MSVKAAVPKESQATQSVKLRDSQTEQLAGIQLSSLHKTLQCVGKTPGYVRHPRRTNGHNIRCYVCPSRVVQGPGKVPLLAQEATRST